MNASKLLTFLLFISSSNGQDCTNTTTNPITPTKLNPITTKLNPITTKINPITTKLNPITTTKINPIITTKTTTNQPIPTINQPTNGVIPITSGKEATLTYFVDSTTQCYGENIPNGNGVAINPLLLGFTEDDWTSEFSGASPSEIPWCGKTLLLTVNGMSFSAIIIDTCDPVGNIFADPVTGQPIGGKCDYTNVIDLYGESGRQFLQNAVGDDFFSGEVEWSII